MKQNDILKFVENSDGFSKLCAFLKETARKCDGKFTHIQNLHFVEAVRLLPLFGAGGMGTERTIILLGLSVMLNNVGIARALYD